MTAWTRLQVDLAAQPRIWLITGVAGFIGSHLLETLLSLDQYVVGLDNFATGFQRNLDEVERIVGPERWARLHFVEGDVRVLPDCQGAMWHPGAPAALGNSVHVVLHQAALGSVPRSLLDPTATHATNVTGFLNVMVAARDARVQRMVYASSSSVYGDHPALPKTESAIGQPLSPYAAGKYMNELYAGVFARCYDLPIIGLRYFNVFGPRQDPTGAYAAVIPLWASALLRDEPVWINGDGETSRDFCYVANAVQANLLAACTDNSAALGSVFNVAVGDRTTLNELFVLMRDALLPVGVAPTAAANYRPLRAGDVRHSLADIGHAQQLLAYSPTHRLREGIVAAMQWYTRRVR